MFTLLCLIVGDATSSPFAVEIEENKLVSILKKEIKKEKLYKFPADGLTLYLAKENGKIDGKWMKSSDEDKNKLIDGDKNTVDNYVKSDLLMDSANGLDDYFGDNLPKKSEIHVLVKLPEQKGVKRIKPPDYEEEFGKRRIIIVDNLTNYLQSLPKATVDQGCLIAAEGSAFPYPLDDFTKKIYIRNSYKDIFLLFLGELQKNNERNFFGVTGTPGIGKSNFFIYMLYEFITNQSISFQPKNVIYQYGPDMFIFDLSRKIVTEIDRRLFNMNIVKNTENFYVIDGAKSTPLLSSCPTMFISSPRSDNYKKFKKQNSAIEWCFPVWSEEELVACRGTCYGKLISEELFQKKYDIYGGIARSIFSLKETIIGSEMEAALNDADAVAGVKFVKQTTRIFQNSHTLMHVIPYLESSDVHRAYEFSHVDIASRYVGEQLWLRYTKQMFKNISDLYGGSPSIISAHLYEIYGHLLFKQGDMVLECRRLDKTTRSRKFCLQSSQHVIRFGKDSIPESLEENTYYEAADDRNFPAIDSFNQQGMYQFTVADKHPIKGVRILNKICKQLFTIKENRTQRMATLQRAKTKARRKLYFVVPGERFDQFKKQPIEGTVTDLEQYVLKMDVNKEITWKV